MTASIRHLFNLLSAQVDPGRWWPATTRFEIVVGAVLVQNTAWANVERVIAGLAEAEMLAPSAIRNTDTHELVDLIRPCGFCNTKAVYLQSVSTWFEDRDAQAADLSTEQLRAELLGVRGIGPETADDLLLYVYDRPVFIYDAYARRLLAAAGFSDYATYEATKKALDPLIEESGLSRAQLAVFHGLIVEAGKRAQRLGGWSTAYALLISGDFAQDAPRIPPR